ncbi:NTE family protein [Rhizobium sp. SG_E_25_P2]|jgi:NTE family protein|uniref:patatin-like phospholipase family protein n=1 Tax=Rhizobium sp. SG_E_25_P2 TaxID=2879942 RepID=UPI0024731ACE|nr:patatin-like phospholipase family protein [Rhizobium sp. SG_E_25_P2]MDH6264684.1 NTE family protein [Rhizobium sp. SG_E_25_P2]
MIPQGSSAPRVAIAFGGGGARGLAHIHIIEALDELGIRPVRITGSSIGAIMGAGMAAGLSGAEIRDFTLKTVGDPRAVMNRIWSLRPTTLQEFVSGGGFRVGQYNLERILKAFLPESLPEDFSSLTIPFGAIATDYYGEREVLVEQGPLYPALAASAAIPAVFMPVMLEGRVMIDGGIYNPVPFDYLFDDADIVIGVDVVGAPAGEDQQIPRRIESLFGASQLMMQSIIATKLKIRKPDILLRPNVGKIAVLDFLKAADILAMSADVKDELKRALDAAITFRA